MIILDTNVISEPMKPAAHLGVSRWLDRQIEDTLFLTFPVLAELLSGIEKLPLGRRKSGLCATLEATLARLFGARVLPFDKAAAMRYAPLTQQARARGYEISLGDGQIAAIAAVHGFTVATRDTAPFEAAGIPVLNPWEM